MNPADNMREIKNYLQDFPFIFYKKKWGKNHKIGEKVEGSTCMNPSQSIRQTQVFQID